MDVTLHLNKRRNIEKETKKGKHGERNKKTKQRKHEAQQKGKGKKRSTGKKHFRSDGSSRSRRNAHDSVTATSKPTFNLHRSWAYRFQFFVFCICPDSGKYYHSKMQFVFLFLIAYKFHDNQVHPFCLPRFTQPPFFRPLKTSTETDCSCFV